MSASPSGLAARNPFCSDTCKVVEPARLTRYKMLPDCIDTTSTQKNPARDRMESFNSTMSMGDLVLGTKAGRLSRIAVAFFIRT